MGKIIKTALIFLVVIIVFVSLVFGGKRKPEKYYQKKWCDSHNGRMNTKMPDVTYCDCETDTHVIDVAFADHWAETIGNALHYSKMTRKKGGIVLIGHHIGNQTEMIRVSQIIKKFNLPIDLFVIKTK